MTLEKSGVYKIKPILWSNFYIPTLLIRPEVGFWKLAVALALKQSLSRVTAHMRRSFLSTFPGILLPKPGELWNMQALATFNFNRLTFSI
jgi:hypothetical protein